MASEIKFRFICSGDSASYEIVRYGHPDNGRRVEIQSRTYALYYADGRRVHKRYNYTIEQYMRQVVSVLGYLHWECRSWEPLPEEYAHAFVAYSKANYEEGKARAIRDRWYDPQYWPEYEPTIKGVAQYVFDEHDRTRGHWHKTRINFS